MRHTSQVLITKTYWTFHCCGSEMMLAQHAKADFFHLPPLIVNSAGMRWSRNVNPGMPDAKAQFALLSLSLGITTACSLLLTTQQAQGSMRVGCYVPTISVIFTTHTKKNHY